MTHRKVMQFSEVCRVYQPETISKKSLPTNGIYPVYGANGKIGFNDKFNHEEPQLLLGCRGSVGSVHISEPFSWINGNAMVVQPFEELVIRDYLKYALLGGIDISDAISGTAQPQITRESLSKIKIPIPNLERQREIVAKLDSAFAAFEFLKVNQSNSAKHANSVLQSYIDRLLLRDDSVYVPLNDLATLENGDRGSNYPNKNMREEMGIPFINAGHIGHGKLDMSQMDYIAKSTFNKLSRGKIRKNDILFCLRGSLGKTAILTDLDEGAIASSLVIVRSKDGVSPKYLSYYFLSSKCKSEIEEFRSGTAQPNLGAADLKKFLVPLHSEDQMQEIVSKLDALVHEIEALNENVDLRNIALTELKQSILNNAFTEKKDVA